MQRRNEQPTPPNSQSPLFPSTQNAIGLPTSPIRFATSTNAFGLTSSPASSSSSGQGHNHVSILGNVETSPLSGVKPRLRRPSMLSLGPPTTFKAAAPDRASDDEEDMEGGGPEPARGSAWQAGSSRMFARTGGNLFEVSQPTPRWTSGPGFLSSKNREDSGSAIGLEALSTTTPPIPTTELITDNLSLLDRSPPRWLPGHLGRRKGKARADDAPDGMPSHPDAHRPPLTGPPLPASLLATLKSETSPLDHEYKSEARLQRLISSHPRAVPFTPRTSRSSRGRFPDEAGDEDDEDDFPSRRALWASRAWTRRSSSDSDSDDMSSMPMDDYGIGGNGRGIGSGGEPVNTAFAAGMDMERIASASEQEGSGKSTPGAGSGSGSVPPNGATTPAGANMGVDRTRPPRMSFSGGLIASPGAGFGLPSAFGGLGMGGGTPIGSPTIERLDLATSPLSNSPSLMQYRESTGGSASHRPGKRKANMDDRFDPYKRPRGSSPALSTSSMGGMLGMSPSRASNIPIPGSATTLSFGQGLSGNTLPATGLAGSLQGTGAGGLVGGGGNGGTGFSTGTFTTGPPSSPMPSYNTLTPPTMAGATAPPISAGGSNMTNLRQGPGRSGHPYTRPMSSRSRAPSPALSVGSTSGLSSGMGANRERGYGTGVAGGLGQAFQMGPLGQGQGSGQGLGQGAGSMAGQQQQQQRALGSLGFLSLANGQDAGDGGTYAREGEGARVQEQEPREGANEDMDED